MKKLIVLLFFGLILSTAFAAKILDNALIINDPGNASADKIIKLGPNRIIRSNETSGEIEFSFDGGTNYSTMGSGGGGGGENFNNIFVDSDNPNSEKGEAGWTGTGGTFVSQTTDPLEGKASFEFTPAAQNDERCSALLDFDKDVVKGRSCEGRIDYIGGDLNLDLLVVDGNGTILNPLFGTTTTDGNNRSLPVHTIAAPHSVSFLCPSAADIAGDSLKGDIKLCVKNVGASASPIIKWDKSYMGTLQGLTETTTPDTLTAVMNGVSCAVISENVSGWVTSTIDSAVGDCFVDYSGLGLTYTPSISASITYSGGVKFASANSATSSGVSLNSFNAVNTLEDPALYFITLTKQESEAKQSVQVYKSIPKVSENENEFNIQLSTTDTSATCGQSSENVPWTNGCSTAGGTGDNKLTFKSGVFTAAPRCSCTVENAGDRECTLETASTYLVYHVRTSAGTGVNDTVNIFCSKSKDDYKKPTVQPIIVGQVVNSYAENASKNVRVESCLIANSGTPSAVGGMCAGWVDSIVDTALGTATVNFKPGIFNGAPECTCSAKTSAGWGCNPNTTLSTSALFYTVNSTNNLADADFIINCKGER